MPVYPWGGNQMSFSGYAHAHNAWLSMADMAGWIPLGVLIIYTVLTASETVCWIVKTEITTERKLITAGLLCVFFLFYTVERIFEGALHFLTPYLFINGLIHGELWMMKNTKNRKVSL